MEFLIKRASQLRWETNMLAENAKDAARAFVLQNPSTVASEDQMIVVVQNKFFGRGDPVFFRIEELGDDIPQLREQGNQTAIAEEATETGTSSIKSSSTHSTSATTKSDYTLPAPLFLN